MDKLTAYKVLGLNNDASVDMIKEAYASLSKKYHPEDNPEEFQRIHEAYVTLTRRNRRTNRIAVEYSLLEQKSKEEKEEIDLVFNKVYSYKEDINEDPRQEFAFEESIRKAEEEVERRREEQERLRLEKEQREAEELRIKQQKLDKEKERLLEEARQEYARKQEEERKKREENQYNFDISDKRYSIKQDTVSTNKFVVIGGVLGIILFILIKMIFEF